MTAIIFFNMHLFLSIIYLKIGGDENISIQFPKDIKYIQADSLGCYTPKI